MKRLNGDKPIAQTQCSVHDTKIVYAGSYAAVFEAKFAEQPRPSMQPVVSSYLTSEYPLGTFNSRAKIVAELDARDVAYNNDDPFRGKEGNSLVERLKALPDVFTSTVDGRMYLPRKGPSWEVGDDDEDAEIELLEDFVAGRADLAS